MVNFSSKLVALVTIAVLASSFVEAQISVMPPVLSIEASPSSPSSGETVTVRAVAPSFDKNALNYDWSISGVFREDLSGIGKHTITLTAGNVGSSIPVRVAITSPDGAENSASRTIRVADLSLLWFAETYVPAWYKGKALPTQQSIVRLVAIPDFRIDGIRIPTDKLIYIWSLDDEERILTGTGEQIFRVKTSDFLKSSNEVRVVVEDIDKALKKEARLFVANTDPRVEVYPFLPLGGIQIRSLTAGNFPFKDVIDIIAEPFFFSVSSKKELSYSWAVAGNYAQGSPANPDIITLQGRNGEDSSIPISVSVDDKNPMTGRASKIFNLVPQTRF